MIIGLSGYAQSGKDTVANILVEKYGFRRIAFADAIRTLLYDMDPLVPHEANSVHYRLQDLVDTYGWDKAKVDYPEIRRLLQDLGVGGRNLFGDMFWIHHALANIEQYEDVVISDVRFTNEAEWVQKFGQIWRIKRLNTEAVNSHVSESDMDDYPVDQVFINNGTIEDLEILIGARMRALV